MTTTPKAVQDAITERDRQFQAISAKLKDIATTDILGRAEWENYITMLEMLAPGGQSVPNVLIHYITIRGVLSQRSIPITAFPAAYQLTKVGSNAYPAIFSKMDGKCTELELKILAHVMCHIDGTELAKARLDIARRAPLEKPNAREDVRRSSVFQNNAGRVLEFMSDALFLRHEIE